MKKKEKNKVLSKFRLFPYSIISLAIIYPGLSLFIKLLSSNYTPNTKIDCQVLPGEISGIILLSEIVIMYIWISLLPKVNNAIFLMLYGAFGFFSIGSFFLLLTHVILFCPPITPTIHSDYPMYLGLFILFSIVIFIIHIKSRIKKTIEINGRKIDFSNMVFSINEYPIHVDTKKSTKLISAYAISAAFTGLILAKIIGGYLGNDYKLISLLTVLIFLSYMLVGYFMVMQLYSTYIVYKRTKLLNKKMTIKEFNN